MLKAAHLTRAAILAQAPDAKELLIGEIEMDESYFVGGRKGKRAQGAASEVPVFGILEPDGVVKAEVLKDVAAQSS